MPDQDKTSDYTTSDDSCYCGMPGSLRHPDVKDTAGRAYCSVECRRDAALLEIAEALAPLAIWAAVAR